jgi:hypothetical protein
MRPPLDRLARACVTLGLAAPLLATAPVVAQEPQLLRLRPPETTQVWVGERVRFQVELLSPTFFAGAPRFALPEVPGLILMRVDARPVVDTTRIDGETYSRQTHQLVAFAARPGEHTIPAIQVDFGLAGVGGAPGRQVSSSTEPFAFEARQPPGATGLVPACRELVVEESWDPPPEGALQVGDALRRTVTIRAEGTTGMLLPPLPELEVEGFAVYRSGPEVRDTTERGAFRCERRQTLTFLAQEAGRRAIPALRLTWLDLAAGELRYVTLPAVELEVTAAEGEAAAAGENEDAPAAPTSSPWRRLAWLLPIALVAIGGAWSLRRRARDPERLAFRALRAACATSEPARIDAALRAWLAALAGPAVPPSTEGLSRLPGGEAVARELLGMQAAWVGADAGWSAGQLRDALSELRRTLRSRPRGAPGQRALPSGLNPGGRPG